MDEALLSVLHCDGAWYSINKLYTKVLRSSDKRLFIRGRCRQPDGTVAELRRAT